MESLKGKKALFYADYGRKVKTKGKFGVDN